MVVVMVSFDSFAANYNGFLIISAWCLMASLAFEGLGTAGSSFP